MFVSEVKKDPSLSGHFLKIRTELYVNFNSEEKCKNKYTKKRQSREMISSYLFWKN